MKPMRPQLLLRGIQDLHDARYCSAVGIYLLAFQMDPVHPEYVSYSVIKEIFPWLSGPESIGDFGDEPAQQILAIASELDLNRISVPLSVALDSERAALFPEGWIIRLTERYVESADLPVLHALLLRYPGAYAEYRLEAGSGLETELIQYPALVERGILHYDQPDSIYAFLRKSGLQAWAFALGTFVRDEQGGLDYERCDSFVETYDSLLPA